jgi:hypothetical protein
MALTDKLIMLCGLVEIVLPDQTIRLTDGGFLDWPARGFFDAEDDTFGVIESVEPVGEAISDEAPGGRITLLPKSIAAAGDLFRSDAQGSPIRFWLAEVDRSTGLLFGTPELLFDGVIDTLSMRIGRQGRHVDIEFMAAAERLFMVREGNVLSARFHETAWPGEKGFDFCTGAGTQVPWGVPDPGRGVVPFFGRFLPERRTGTG